MTPRLVELLAPAGSFDKLTFALEYGADAVYVGGKSFSLREGAANFSPEDLSRAVDTVHGRGKKIFLTSNIFFHDHHWDDFRPFLHELSPLGLDGIILSDIGAIDYVREKYPELPVHVSTQANTVNSVTVRFYEKLGVSRVILARELSLNEIRTIRQNTSLELECFVHGAMCIAQSGRCLLSNYFTNAALSREGEKTGLRKDSKTRDANLGDCSQSCRWEYSIIESSRRNQPLPVEENEHGTSILSSKDLNLSLYMRELIDAGINSFKIEGRMKSVYYVGLVTGAYRHAIDMAIEGKSPRPEVVEELEKISHREYTTGFYFGHNLALAPTKSGGYLRDYTFLAYITEMLSGNRARVRAMNQILTGSPIEVVVPQSGAGQISAYRLIKENMVVDKIQPNDDFILEWDDPVELKAYTLLRRKD